jgi:HTH-type transcriptional regulator/antitoxin HigA
MRNTTRTNGRSNDVSNPEINIRIDAWAPLAGTIFVPHTEEEYDRIVVVMDLLVDEVGEDETHALASMMEILGVLIEHYENAHVPELEEE